MQAIVFEQPGDADVLYLTDVPSPSLPAGHVRIKVWGCAINRADLLQRQGKYAAPAGASPILGLECAGTIQEVAPDVHAWQVGQRVMALLSGGGYASEVVVHAGSVMAVPTALSDAEAAALPETYLTAFFNIFMLGEAKEGQHVLIHGGGSGVGTAAISLCKAAGITSWVTAGSPEKCNRCLEHGAGHAINYREQKFAEIIRDGTAGRGVNIILDCIGGSYLEDNLQSLTSEGRLMLIATMGGGSGTANLALMLRKRLQIIASTLRARTPELKATLVSTFLQQFGAALEAGQLRPVVDSVMPLADAAASHKRLASSQHFGKVVLRVQREGGLTPSRSL